MGWEKRRLANFGSPRLATSLDLSSALTVPLTSKVQDNELTLVDRISSLLEASLNAAEGSALSATDISKLVSALAQLQLVRARANGVWGAMSSKAFEQIPQCGEAVPEENIKQMVPIYEAKIDKNGKFHRSRPALVGYCDSPPNPDSEGHEPGFCRFIVEVQDSETGQYRVAHSRAVSSEKGADIIEVPI